LTCPATQSRLHCPLSTTPRGLPAGVDGAARAGDGEHVWPRLDAAAVLAHFDAMDGLYQNCGICREIIR